MLKKKFFAKAMAFAMAAGLLAAAAPVGAVRAGDPVEGTEAVKVKGEIDYINYTLTITPKTGDNYVFLEVLKKEGDTKPGTIYPYPCKAGAVTIDLSFLKAAKPSYIRIWGDKNTEKVSMTVSGQPAKSKFKYTVKEAPVKDEADDAFAEKLLKYYKDSFGITGTGNYEFKPLYGHAWSDLADLDLATAKVAGTTLVMREAAVESEAAAEGKPAVVGAPAGAEVKVKVSAMPKAPKVTIDYTKDTVKLPKKAQYGIIDANGDLKYVDCAAGGAIAPSKILEEVGKAAGKTDTALTEYVEAGIEDGFTLVVRTKDDKKGVSLPAFVTVKAHPTFTDNESGKLLGGADGATEIATYKFDDAGVTLTFSAGGFEYKNGEKWTKITSGRAIKGKTSLTLRIAGVKDKDETKSSLPSVTEVTIAKDMTAVEITNTGDLKVEAGQTLALTVKVTDKKGEAVANPTLTWTSSDETKATVANGTVTAKAAGKVTITVSYTAGEGNKAVTVTDKVEVEVTAAPTTTP